MWSSLSIHLVVNKWSWSLGGHWVVSILSIYSWYMALKSNRCHSILVSIFSYLIQSICHICRLVHWLSKPPEIGFDSWRFGGYNTILSGFQFSTHRKRRLVQLGEKWILEMTIWHFLTVLVVGMFLWIWRRTKHRMLWKRQSCASIVFPIKIKEKESVRLRNPRSRITFPLNLIYPPSQSMQFHRGQTS